MERKVSETEFFKRFNTSSFLHSGLLPDHEMFGIKLMFLLVGFPIFVVLAVGCLGWVCLNRPDFLPRMLQRQHKFTPSMLKAATNGRRQLRKDAPTKHPIKHAPFHGPRGLVGYGSYGTLEMQQVKLPRLATPTGQGGVELPG